MKSLSSTLLSMAVVTALILSEASNAQTLNVTNGLQLWLKADGGVTTNAAGGVTGWADQTANHNDAAQTDGTLAPVLVPAAQNGKPVLRFDGVDDYLDVASSPSIAIAGDISSFFVVKVDDFLTYRAVWAKTVGNLPGPTDYYLLPSTGIPRGYRGDGTSANLGSVDATTRVPAGNYVVLGFKMAGTTYTHYLNGQAVGSGEIAAVIADGGMPLKIGTRDDLFTKMKGDIAELTIYDRALTQAEITSLVTGLQTKYGILNQPPTARITAPADNSQAVAPFTITLAATAADIDGVVSKVDFFANGALLGTATAPPYKMQVQIKTAGTITLWAVATDNKGATGKATNVTVTATSATAPGFTATKGLKLHLKADSGVTTNAAGGVTLWSDQTTNHNDAIQADGTLAPLLVAGPQNGKPVLRFDGIGDFMDVAAAPSIAIAGDISSFFVVRFEDYATYRAVWAKTSGNLPAPTDYYLLPGSGIPRGYRGDGTQANLGSVDATAAVPTNSYVVLGFDMAGTTYTHYLNGQAVGSGQITATLADGGTPLKIGTRDDSVTRMKGDIAELMIYDQAMPAADRASLAAYLGGKYGIPLIEASNSLPMVSITSPTSGGVISAPTNFIVAATASDSDGSIVKVEFLANGALIGSSTKSPFTTGFMVPTGGAISLVAVATDNLGGKTASSPITLTANASGASPLSVTSGLRLWLKADAGVTANASGLVTTWADFSGNFNNGSQGDLSAMPLLVAGGLNQLPTIRFDGVNDYLEVFPSPSIANGGDITSLFVVKFDDFATFRAVWAKTEGNQPRSTDYYIAPASGVPRAIRGGPSGIAGVDGGAPFVAGTFAIGGFEMAGTTLTHYLDGVASGSGEITNTLLDAGNPLRIGTRGDFGTRLKGELAELLIYNNALSDTDRDKVTQYLRTKYFVPVETLRFTSIQKSADSIVITWNSIANLQATDRLGGLWTTIKSAASSVTITNSGSARFFRLMK